MGEKLRVAKNVQKRISDYTFSHPKMVLINEVEQFLDMWSNEENDISF